MTEDPSPDPGRSTVPAVGRSPFADTLRAAIIRSGLGLERLRHRLAQRELAVSAATLSHWQTGRSVPSGDRSLRVVAGLEEVLDVDPGALTRQIPRPRPRGRSGNVEPADAGGLRSLPVWEDLAAAVERLGLTLDGRILVSSCHEVAEVGPDRRMSAHRVRAVLRAVVSGVDRLPLYYCDDAPHPSLPRVVPRVGFRIGRSVHDPRTGLYVAEVVLDTPLRAGERVFLEYDVEHAPTPMTRLELRGTHRIREAVISVRFASGARPVDVVEYTEVAGEARSRSVTPDEHGAASVVRHSLAPGAVGLRWSWDERADAESAG